MNTIPGYEIQEPVGQSIKYHLMFSSEFGVERTSTDTTETQLMDIGTFLESQFLICQSYRINDRDQLVLQPICLWSMGDMKREYIQRQDQYSTAP